MPVSNLVKNQNLLIVVVFDPWQVQINRLNMCINLSGRRQKEEGEAEVISTRVVDRTGVNKAGTNDGSNSSYHT